MKRIADNVASTFLTHDSIVLRDIDAMLINMTAQ
jgi:hypothetical protein